MNVPNPATGANAAGAMQAYEIPPNREDHRYEVTLSEWTPSSLAFHVRFLNADRCGLSSSYSLELVDDAGRHYPFIRPGSFVKRPPQVISARRSTTQGSMARSRLRSPPTHASSCSRFDPSPTGAAPPSISGGTFRLSNVPLRLME